MSFWHRVEAVWWWCSLLWTGRPTPTTPVRRHRQPHISYCSGPDFTLERYATGFYVAKSKGWYEAENIKVEFVSPHVSGYTDTPVSLLTQDKVNFAIAPSESVVSAHTLQSAAAIPTVQASISPCSYCATVSQTEPVHCATTESSTQALMLLG